MKVLHRKPTPRRRWLRRLLALLLVALVVVNTLAWVQARASTQFVEAGEPLSTAAITQLPMGAMLRAALLGVPIPRPQNRHTPAEHYLPYETRSIALANGEQLEAWLVPHPQPAGVVLLFSGYAGVKEGLLTPAAHMFQWGYSALLVDFRGAGGSSRSDTTIGMREADDVAAAVAYARAQWPELPVALYGVSMGAAAIIRATGALDVRPAAVIAEGSFDSLLTTTRHRFDAVGAPSFPAAELLLFWGSMQTGYNGFANNPAEFAAGVTCPTLLLHGELDPWVTAAETEAIAARVRGLVEVLHVPGRGHEMPFVYGAPELWVRTVRPFLDGAMGR
jgi:alpha-beta hydrolase superfamily lysophospholipase